MTVWRLSEPLDKVNFLKEKSLLHDKEALDNFWARYYPYNAEQLEELQSASSRKEIVRLKVILCDSETCSSIKIWCARVLAIIDGYNAIDFLDQIRSKLQPQEKTVNKIYDGYQLNYQWQVISGLAESHKIDSAKLTDVLCKYINQEIELYLYALKDSANYMSNGALFLEIGKTLASVSEALVEQSSIPKSLPVIEKNQDILKNAFVKTNCIDPVLLADLGFWQITRSNIAKILMKLELNDFVKEEINSNLSGLRTTTSSMLAVMLSGEFGDAETARILFKNLNDKDFFEKQLLEALGMIGRKYSDGRAGSEVFDEMIEPLTKRMLSWEKRAIEFRNNPDPSEIDTETMGLRYLRTIEYIMTPEKTAVCIAQKGVSSKGEESRLFARALGGLTKKQLAFNELKSKFFEGNKQEKETAEMLMTEMGLTDAVRLLVAQDAEQLYAEYVGKPIQAIEMECKGLLTDTVEQVKKGYRTINIMGIIVFIMGIFIIGLGAIIAIFGISNPVQLIAGGASMLAGIATVLLNFARGPVKIVQKALADLVQVETAFIGYIRRTGLASFVFLREYIQKEKPADNRTLELCNQQMNEAAKDTLALIELYSGESGVIKNLAPDKREMLCSRAIGTEQVNKNIVAPYPKEKRKETI